MKTAKFLLIKFSGPCFFCLLVLWAFTSCSKKEKPSFLIIAADQLSFGSFFCGEDKTSTYSGLNTLCQESIRFSNAYTTSTQTAAAMGSLLSGLYPFQHQLHRSFDRISAKVPLVQEILKKQNYRTSFWSGKPTVLKKPAR